jgi:methyl-accepting chemotaxis protein
LFAGDVDTYVSKILEAMATGKSQEHYVKASDGRIVLAEPLPGGGWVSTHEDVTEQRRADEERAAIRGQEERRANIDSAIASFRPTVETLLSTVSESATAMRLDGADAIWLLRTDFPACRKRCAGIPRSIDERRNRGCRRR